MTLNGIKKREFDQELLFKADTRVINLSQECIQEIINLRKEGCLINQIASKLELNRDIIRNILYTQLKIERMNQENQKFPDLPAKLFKIYNRICTQVEQEDLVSFDEYCIEEAMELFSKIRPKTKYRNYQKILPVAMYLSLKLKGMPLHTGLLFAKEHISRKEFNCGIRNIAPLYEEYQNRNKKEVIRQYLVSVNREFRLGDQFIEYSQKALEFFYKDLSRLKEQLMAGVISYMSLLLTNNPPNLITSICDYLGIASCSLYPTFKRFLRYNNDSSTHNGIISSQDKIRNWLLKLQPLFT